MSTYLTLSRNREPRFLVPFPGVQLGSPDPRAALDIGAPRPPEPLGKTRRQAASRQVVELTGGRPTEDMRVGPRPTAQGAS
jgi:hypothetical protein